MTPDHSAEVSDGREQPRPDTTSATTATDHVLSSRYDDFQSEAVQSVVADFSDKPAGRFLLVIPTGGGKTFTAVKAMNRLFSASVLDAENDTILWVAHRDELLTQAEGTFARFATLYPDEPSFANRVLFTMISKAGQRLESDRTVKMVVIDEAHHGAANSYQPLFAKPAVGVLGLTATPTRHDGKPLEFERESYSIGFPDLVDFGVILRPEVRTAQGGQFDISNLEDVDQLEALNNQQRNDKIVAALLAAPDDYKKVVIYVGTKKHAEDLCYALRQSPLKPLYESIGFIIGDKNSRQLDRKNFLAAERKLKRSILVNVQVLSEGYDDPSINTVVMATPTRSKLVYMQAMGRAIRHDPDDELKRAFVVEVVDELPNIRYRIDNRWLYSDISDQLEPAVVDREFADLAELTDRLHELYELYDVDADLRAMPKTIDNVRYSLLLFKYYAEGGRYKHVPLLIDNSNRLQVSNFYNFLSERMARFVSTGTNCTQAIRMAGIQRIPTLPSDRVSRLIFDAMCNCVKPDLSAAMPWITFVSFRLRRRPNSLPADLISFLSDLINRDEIKEKLLRREFPPNSVLVKFPLPLGHAIGRILHHQEFLAVSAAVDELCSMVPAMGDSDHRNAVRQCLGNFLLPIPYQDAETLPIIVREHVDYFRHLS